MKYITSLLAIISLISCNLHEETTTNYNTQYFEFHNNYWVNLHHFLYQKADSSQLKKLQEDDLNFLEIGEYSSMLKLSKNEKEVLEQAIIYYQKNLTSKSLRRDLNPMRLWLQKRQESTEIIDTSFSKEFTEILNKVSPIYKKYFWEIHKSHNSLILNNHISNIKAVEKEVINKMEVLSLNPWPDSTKVRVDITAYANWAGAYTSSKPQMNIILSTLDPSSTTNAFVETVFHEGSHLLYLYGKSPIRDKFYYKSKELDIDFPRNLWHASMFYLCGRVTQDALAELGMNHEMLIDEKNIFSNYNTNMFRTINESYYLGKIEADSMIVELLNSINKKSH